MSPVGNPTAEGPPAPTGGLDPSASGTRTETRMRAVGPSEPGEDPPRAQARVPSRAQFGGAFGGPQSAPRPRSAGHDRRGPTTFDEIAELIRAKRDLKLLIEIERYARPGPVRPGQVEISLDDGAPAHLAGALRERLIAWTGAPWSVVIASGHDGPTLMERRAAEEEGLRREALADPLVLAALETFPGAELKTVRPLRAAEEEAPLPQAPDDLEDDALLDYDDGWDAAFDDRLDGAWEPDPDPQTRPPPGRDPER